MRWFHASGVRATALWLALGTTAAAQPAALGSAQLHYLRGRGAEACPDEAALEREVVARLGYDPFQRTAQRSIDVTVVLDENALHATLALSAGGPSSPSTHRLASAGLDCAVLHSSMALAIALAIDPARALDLDAQPAPVLAYGTRPRSAQPFVAPPQVPSSNDAPVGPPKAHPKWLAYAGGYVSVAMAPSMTGGIVVGGAVRYPALSVAAELHGDMPSQGGITNGHVTLGRLYLEGVPCFRASAFGMCALAAVGVSLARGDGFAVSRNAQAPFIALGARLMVDIPLTARIGLQLHADVLGLVTRLDLKVSDDTRYRDAPAGGAFGIDVVGRFGDGS